jgi:eukaryotic-like serine/threonine-protein kinase
MTPERWAVVKGLFDEAAERAAAERADFLRAACGADEELRWQVEDLLAAHAAAGSFIERPALDKETLWFDGREGEPPAADLNLRRIGPYRLLKEIGKGGMGAVYLAVRDDDEYRKEVAVKLIKRGMDTEDVIRRFRHERQILASLDHPHIARLLDGGTSEDGLPYFVMEHIAGEPIDRYCDRHSLSIAARLRLFRDVCAAVHYAHQRLVVHRDLKPSNILVTPDGTPKLLDFGIARVLDPEAAAEFSELTRPGDRVMTPEYASPEQVRAEAVTTASDVYTLGVILYELLSGRRPYRLKRRTLDEYLRVICEQEPERPSTAVGRVEIENGADPLGSAVTPETVSRTREGQPARLRRRLRGDLDNIVLKALQKEPARRYGSAERLADDLRRHLEGLPVTAQTATPFYRSAKFVRRHRVGVTAAALIALTLISGSAATLRQARIARAEQVKAEAARTRAVTAQARAESEQARAESEQARAEVERRRAETKQAEAEAQRLLAVQSRLIAETERARAEGRFEDVRQLANSFVFEFHDAIAQLEGATPVRALLVRRAIEYLDRLAGEAKGNLALQEELAAAYQKIGDVQGRPLYSNLGDTGGARESYRKALGVRAEIAAARPADKQAQLNLALSHDRYGDVLAVLAEARQSLASYRSELQILERLAAAAPQDVAVKRHLGRALMKVGDALSGMMAGVGGAADALNHYRRSLALREEVWAANRTDVDDWMDYSISYNRLSLGLQMVGDTKGALAAAERCLALARENAAAHPGHTQARREIALAQNVHSQILSLAGSTKEAVAAAREALQLSEALSAADPSNANLRFGVAQTLKSVGELLVVTGDSAEAVKLLHQARAAAEKLVGTDALNELFRSLLAQLHLSLGQALYVTGDGQAGEHYRRGLALSEQVAAKDVGNITGQSNLAQARLFFTQYLLLAGDQAGAASEEARLTPQAEKLAAADPTSVSLGQLRFQALNLRGYFFEAQGEAQQAAEFYRRAQALAAAAVERDPGNFGLKGFLPGFQISLGRLASAAKQPGAREHFKQAVTLAHSLVAADPENLFWQETLAQARSWQGGERVQAGAWAEAAADYGEALQIMERISARDPANTYFRGPLQLFLGELAAVTEKAGDAAAARRYGARYLAISREQAARPAATPADLALYAYQLLEVMPAELRRPAEAVEHARRAVELSGGKDYRLLRVLIKAHNRNGDRASAIRVAREALAVTPTGSAERKELEAFLEAAAKPQ